MWQQRGSCQQQTKVVGRAFVLLETPMIPDYSESEHSRLLLQPTELARTMRCTGTTANRRHELRPPNERGRYWSQCSSTGFTCNFRFICLFYFVSLCSLLHLLPNHRSCVPFYSSFTSDCVSSSISLFWLVLAYFSAVSHAIETRAIPSWRARDTARDCETRSFISVHAVQ